MAENLMAVVGGPCKELEAQLRLSGTITDREPCWLSLGPFVLLDDNIIIHHWLENGYDFSPLDATACGEPIADARWIDYAFHRSARILFCVDCKALWDAR